MLEAGTAPYEVLVELSESLGHGPSRVQMILAHYCQPIRDRFENQVSGQYIEADRRRKPSPLPRAQARLLAKRRHGELSGYPVGRRATSRDAAAAADGLSTDRHKSLP